MTEVSVNPHFDLKKDPSCWIVVHHTFGSRVDRKSKAIIPTHTTRNTYHVQLIDACKAIIDRSAEGTSVDEIVAAINRASEDVQSAIAKLKL